MEGKNIKTINKKQKNKNNKKKEQFFLFKMHKSKKKKKNGKNKAGNHYDKENLHVSYPEREQNIIK